MRYKPPKSPFLSHIYAEHVETGKCSEGRGGGGGRLCGNRKSVIDSVSVMHCNLMELKGWVAVVEICQSQNQNCEIRVYSRKEMGV